jgi:hypothetical protein
VIGEVQGAAAIILYRLANNSSIYWTSGQRLFLFASSEARSVQSPLAQEKFRYLKFSERWPSP